MREQWKRKPYYISTAIAYTSAKPHIGNTYEIVLADAIARYKRMTGYDVYFQTGTDEHGQKIQEKAEAAGITPQQYVDNVAGQIKEIWDLMNTTYDRFVRTTDPMHVEKVQKIFKKLYDQGDIYKGSYKGKYCTPCESFWTESQLVDGKCPDCGRPVVDAEEEAYFFRMSKYADRLMEYIETHPDFIQPESRKNEMVNNFLKPGLQDLCVSRTSFNWGVPVTFDRQARCLRLAGRADQLYHLLRLGPGRQPRRALQEVLAGGRTPHRQGHHPLPHHLLADLPHGAGRGAAQAGLWPSVAAGRRRQDVQVRGQRHLCRRPWSGTFGVDAVRYYVLHEIPFANDGVLTYEMMMERINSDLANVLGNLVNRTIAMDHKYFDGKIMEPCAAEPVDEELKAMALALPAKVEARDGRTCTSRTPSTRSLPCCAAPTSISTRPCPGRWPRTRPSRRAWAPCCTTCSSPSASRPPCCAPTCPRPRTRSLPS